MNVESNIIRTMLENKPGVLIMNELVAVSRPPNETSFDEIIRFVLDTERDDKNQMTGMILSSDYTQLNKSIMKFFTIEEFFALKNYLSRNGITKY